MLLIDEAHAMPAESLEEIRLLSNLESKATKLLQIALFAQPELDERLAATDMRQLRERITQHFNLAPLKQADVAAYLEFRLRAAGYHGPNPFTDEAIRQITRISEGLSRRINIIADKALLAAYSNGSHKVDVGEVKTAEQDARFSPLQAKTAFNAQPLLWGLASAGMAAVLIAMVVNGGLSPGLTCSPCRTHAPHRKQPATPPTATRPTPTAPLPAATEKIRFGPLTRQHLAQYEEWIKDAPRQRYFIQLLATDATHTGEVEGFLARAVAALEPAQIRVYRSSLSGRDRVGVIFGDFDTREEAVAAMQAMPDSIKTIQPFPRQVSKLK